MKGNTTPPLLFLEELRRSEVTTNTPNECLFRGAASEARRVRCNRKLGFSTGTWTIPNSCCQAPRMPRRSALVQGVHAGLDDAAFQTKRDGRPRLTGCRAMVGDARRDWDARMLAGARTLRAQRAREPECRALRQRADANDQGNEGRFLMTEDPQGRFGEELSPSLLMFMPSA